MNVYPYTLKESFSISRIKILQGTVLNIKYQGKNNVFLLIQAVFVYEESKLITFPLVCATGGKVLEQNAALGIRWITWGKKKRKKNYQKNANYIYSRHEKNEYKCILQKIITLGETKEGQCPDPLVTCYI